MKVSISREEFSHIREGIQNLGNPKVSQEFNSLLKNENPHMKVTKDGNSLIIDIDEVVTSKILGTIVPHMAKLGKDINPTVFALPKILADGKEILADLKSVL